MSLLGAFMQSGRGKLPQRRCSFWLIDEAGPHDHVGRWIIAATELSEGNYLGSSDKEMLCKEVGTCR